MGTAKEAWDSIQMEWGKNTDMRRSHAQEALNRTIYVEETEIQDHVKLLWTRKAAVDNLSTSVMDDETWRGIIIRSIPPTPKWLPVIPSLYAMSSSADIISMLLAHGMIIGRGTINNATANPSSTVLTARVTEGCSNPNCEAKKRSTHTTANCYWPGGGKEGQFPPNFGQRNRVNAAVTTPSNATPTSSQPEHFVLSARNMDTPGRSGVLIDNAHHDGDSPGALISRGFQSFQKGKIPTFMDSGQATLCLSPGMHSLSINQLWHV